MLLGDHLPAEEAFEWRVVWSCVNDDALMLQAIDIVQ